VKKPKRQKVASRAATMAPGHQSQVDHSAQKLTAGPLEDPNTLFLRDDGRPRVAILAESATSPVTLNTQTARSYIMSGCNFPEPININAAIGVTEAKVRRVQAGDLRDVEEMLICHTASLDAIFTELSRRALTNISANVDVAETYMRLALKAQAQCRATHQTIAEMKNPRPVYVQQLNQAVGPQQVNNGKPPPAIAAMRDAVEDFAESKILEASSGKRLDS
jgi:hypothetical protein